MRDEERRENRSGRRASDRAAGAPAWLRITVLVLALIAAAYALMAYPLKDTQLWQYAVPFLSQNQLLGKISRGESPFAEQWAVYLAASLALAAVLWLAAVWRYKQEKLAISG